jgi:tetratricopeptide (TPR) repeat protein
MLDRRMLVSVAGRTPPCPGVAATVAALVATVAVAGCASSKRIAYAPSELKTVVASRLAGDRVGDVVVPFQPTPEMVARALEYVDGSTSDAGRADMLARAITDRSQFGLTYERVATTVAPETVANGQGNCLSLTSLYVGLARAVGLTAYYVDASDRINDLLRHDELIVDTGHIAATVHSGRGWSLVDFTGEISNYRTFRVMDDLEALAHFYNNRGYETITVAQGIDAAVLWRRALRDFEMSSHVMPGFARADNNRGVAMSRLGDDDGAEVAYRAALVSDDTFSAPRHNLGNLYLRKGDFDLAVHWYERAIELQRNNPYVHFHLGLAKYRSGDVAASIAALKRAIALKHDYAEPYYLLARAYRAQGRFEDAERVSITGKSRTGIE